MPSAIFTPAGARFGKLVTLEDASRVTSKVNCRCDCGTTRLVLIHNLRNGNTGSCGCSRGGLTGPANSGWKGDEASYSAFHHRVEMRYGRPSRCRQCGTEDSSVTYDWANLTGHYEDPDDYMRMCRSCHRLFDASRRFAGRWQKVAELTAQGQSSRAIAAVLGVTHQVVLADRRRLERAKSLGIVKYDTWDLVCDDCDDVIAAEA